jgi:glycosyltransferase involved in cell wall biosynthesis
MRILLVIDSFFTGGAEFSTLELFAFLKEKQVDIKICKLKEKKPEYDSDSFDIDQNIITTLPNGSFLIKRKALQKIISEFKPDVIHSVLFKSNLLVRSIRFFNSSFVHLESLVNHSYSENRLNEVGVTKMKLLFFRILDCVSSFFGTDHFHPNGNSVAQHYHEKLGISFKRMTVVYRGRKASNYENAPAVLKLNFGIEEKTLVLINVARQEYQKGQDVLINAMSMLPKDVLEKVHLLIVGREGKSTLILQEQVLNNELNSKITFLGHRTDIPSLLKMADVFVFPSRFEGLPGVLIEAEASGLPIVCTNLSMMLEVVEINKNALTFTLDNSSELADAISELVSSKEMRDSFSEISKKLFKEKFEIESVHQKMYELYIKIIK